VAREIAEELALAAVAGPLLDAWVYHIADEVRVLVVIYGCTAGAMPAVLQSPEGRPVARVPLTGLDGISLPAGYRRAIDAWFASDAGSR
jgi:hypothetical protein